MTQNTVFLQPVHFSLFIWISLWFGGLQLRIRYLQVGGGFVVVSFGAVAVGVIAVVTGDVSSRVDGWLLSVWVACCEVYSGLVNGDVKFPVSSFRVYLFHTWLTCLSFVKLNDVQFWTCICFNKTRDLLILAFCNYLYTLSLPLRNISI